MRSTHFLFVLAGLVILLAGFHRAGGQQNQTEPAKAEVAKAKIVPVLVLKPGEQKELLLSTACTVGVTRGGGFDIREIGGEGSPDLKPAKVWKRNGVMVEVPDFEAGEKQAAAPQYEPLKQAGVSVFSVKVTASQEAKPGAYNLHLADFTCNGTCETDFRVLIIAP